MKHKFGVFYTDGGFRDRAPAPGCGIGIHGYVFDELKAARYAKVPVMLTPLGYVPKLTGAELKDESHNPEYTNWDVGLKVKDVPVCKEDGNVTILDYWESVGKETAQYAELQAFLRLAEYTKDLCEHITVHSDSAYLVLGVNRDMKNWKNNNWNKRDGTPIANHALWLQIYDVFEERGDRIKLLKIKAHADHYGNEAADRNATMGVAQACNGHKQGTWIENDIHDAGYWTPDKTIPIMLRQKWCYALSGQDRALTSVDGELYHHYFMGDHSKSTDDIELLGKMFSDGGFSFVLNKERSPYIDDIKQFHVDNMWDHNCGMYKSDLMLMINCINILRPKNLWEIANAEPSCLFMSGSRNDLSSAGSEELLSKVIRPPRLSYRALDLETEFKEIVYSYLLETGHTLDDYPNFTKRVIKVNDVTDTFYEKSETKAGSAGPTKLSGFYDQVSKSFDFNVKHPFNEKDAKVIFTRGIDLPSRSIMTALATKNPKVSIVTWQFDTIMINFGFIIESDEGIGFWTSYASVRVLSNDEQ